MTTRDEIINAAARAAYVQAWASYREESGKGYPAGCQLMDMAPETPQYAFDWAEKLFTVMETLNRMSTEAMYAHAASLPLSRSWHREATPDDFGHDTAMEALGHGVGWADHHPPHGLWFPFSAEFYCFSETECDGYVADASRSRAPA